MRFFSIRAAVFALAALLVLSSTLVASQRAGGTIAGQIRSSGGDPVARARVSVMLAPSPQEAPSSALVLSRITQTDDTGRYRLDDVPPGRYYVVVGLFDAPTYYPGVVSLAAATIVTVTEGSVTEDLNFAMAPRSAGLRVSGRVRRDSASPALTVQTAALSGPGGSSFQSVVGQDGSFEFPRVPSGIYFLRVQPSTQANSPKTIIVEDRDITDVEVWAPIPVTVTGQVEVENGGPLPRFTISLESSSGNIETPPNPLFQPHGSVRLTLPTGEYRILLKDFPEAYRIRSMTYGRQDLLAGPIKVSLTDPGTLRVKFEFAQPTPFVKVAGRVVGARNMGTASAPNYGFVRFLNDAFFEGPESSIATDGTFTIPRILPGAYTVPIDPIRPTVVVGKTDISGLEIVIPPDRQLSGRVTVDDDSPLPRPTPLSFLGIGPIVKSYELSGFAPDGTFKTTLPEGEYALNVSFPSEFYRVRQSSQLSSGRLSVGADAKELVLALDAIPTAPWARVSGQVIGVEHLPADARRVELSGHGILRALEAPIGPDGRFSFNKVFPGSYSVRLARSPLGSTSVAVEVSPGNLSVGGLSLSVAPQAALTGRIMLPDGEGLSRLTMVLSGPSGTVLVVFPTPPVTASNGANGVILVPIDSKGVFAANLPNGAYRIISVTPPSGFAVESVSSGAQDLLQTPLAVTAGKPIEEIRIVLVRTPK